MWVCRAACRAQAHHLHHDHLFENGGPLPISCPTGCWKQEPWVAEHVGKINVPLMLPVGAAFDFDSGHRPWAPAWVRHAGLEWLFRTVTGGRRAFCRENRPPPPLVRQTLQRNRLGHQTRMCTLSEVCTCEPIPSEGRTPVPACRDALRCLFTIK